MFSRFLAVIGVFAALGLLYLLQTTTPTEAGAMGVLAVFLLLYITLVSLLAFFLFYTYKIIVKLFFADIERRIAARFTFKKSYYYASILALGPVMLISLRSVGKAGLVELFLVAILLIVGCVYVSRQTS